MGFQGFKIEIGIFVGMKSKSELHASKLKSKVYDDFELITWIGRIMFLAFFLKVNLYALQLFDEMHKLNYHVIFTYEYVFSPESVYDY